MLIPGLLVAMAYINKINSALKAILPLYYIYIFYRHRDEFIIINILQLVILAMQNYLIF